MPPHAIKLGAGIESKVDVTRSLGASLIDGKQKVKKCRAS